jgi:hypothetical protein
MTRLCEYESELRRRNIKRLILEFIVADLRIQNGSVQENEITI